MSRKKKQNREILQRISAESSEQNSLHMDLFPEEYDFIYDDYAEAQMRRKGINPMSKEYIELVNNRRKEMGVLPFNQNEATDTKLISSWEYCKRKLLESKSKI